MTLRLLVALGAFVFCLTDAVAPARAASVLPAGKYEVVASREWFFQYYFEYDRGECRSWQAESPQMPGSYTTVTGCEQGWGNGVGIFKAGAPVTLRDNELRPPMRLSEVAMKQSVFAEDGRYLWCRGRRGGRSNPLPVRIRFARAGEDRLRVTVIAPGITSVVNTCEYNKEPAGTRALPVPSAAPVLVAYVSRSRLASGGTVAVRLPRVKKDLGNVMVQLQRGTFRLRRAR